MKNLNVINGTVTIKSKDLFPMLQFNDLFTHQSLIEVVRFGCPIKRNIFNYKQELPIEAKLDTTLFEGVEKWVNDWVNVYKRVNTDNLKDYTWTITFRYTVKDLRANVTRTEKIILKHKKGIPMYALRPQLVKSTLSVDATVNNVVSELKQLQCGLNRSL